MIVPNFDSREGRWYVISRSGSRVRWARVVMMDKLGRDLRSDEHVHHINGVTDDDRVENLEVLSPSDHARLHMPAIHAALGMRPGGRWHDGEACRGCNTTSRPHRAIGLCTRCYRQELRRRGCKPAICEGCGVSFDSYRGARYCSHACTTRLARQINHGLSPVDPSDFAA